MAIPPKINNRKIYISGQITGRPIAEAKSDFATVKYYVEYTYKRAVVSPFDLFSDEEERTFTWRQFMTRDLTALLFYCDTIYMLRNWKESRGARAEHAVAIESDMTIIYEK